MKAFSPRERTFAGALLGALLMTSPVWAAGVDADLVLKESTDIATEEPVVNAFEGLRIGAVASAGTGCVGGNAVDLSFDDQTGLLALDMIGLQAKAGQARRSDRKTCNISIPISVPAGKVLLLRDARVAAHASLRSGADAKIGSEIFFSGARGTQLAKALPARGHSLVRQVRAESQGVILSSACGQDALLRVNTSGIVNAGTDAAALSSLSIQGVSVFLELADCGIVGPIQLGDGALKKDNGSLELVK